MDRVHSRCRTSTFVFMAVMSGKVKRLTVMGQNGYRPVASLEGVLGGMAVMRRSKQKVWKHNTWRRRWYTGELDDSRWLSLVIEI